MAGCPWYIPDFACNAAEQACKDAVRPAVQVAGLVFGIFLLTGVLQLGNFREIAEAGKRRRKNA